MGAEEREQVALFSTSGADRAETREQLSRESSAARGSEVGRKQPKKRHRTLRSTCESTIHPLPPKHLSSRRHNHPLSETREAKEDGRNGFKISHLSLTLPPNR